MLEGLEPNKNLRCKVRTTAASLEDKDSKIFLTAIADTDKWSDKGLSVALSGRGVKISNEAIGRHRRELCACYR
jgi:hypothetical protein